MCGPSATLRTAVYRTSQAIRVLGTARTAVGMTAAISVFPCMGSLNPHSGMQMPKRPIRTGGKGELSPSVCFCFTVASFAGVHGAGGADVVDMLTVAAAA